MDVMVESKEAQKLVENHPSLREDMEKFVDAFSEHLDTELEVVSVRKVDNSSLDPRTWGDKFWHVFYVMSPQEVKANVRRGYQ